MKDHELDMLKFEYGFPEMICPNPKCIRGGIFLPHRKNQIYCCTRCRIKFNNDKRSEEDNTIFLDAKRLKIIDKKLHRMYEKYTDNKGYCAVRKEIFHYEGINVMLLVQEWENKDTGTKIKGYFRYGIELHSENDNYYVIYKLDKL